MTGNTYGIPSDKKVYLDAVNGSNFTVLTAATSGEPTTATVSYMNEISKLSISEAETDFFSKTVTATLNTNYDWAWLGRRGVLSIFDNIARQALDDKSVIFRVIVLYIRVKYLMEKLSSKNIKPEETKSLIEKLAINIYLITANLDAYQKEVNTLLTTKPGGKKRKQKGGMDTAKIYNAQGLVQELSALHQNDTPSPALLFPSPFSASSLTASSGATDTLPPATVAALMPAIPTPQIGGKKKVKSAKRK